MGPIMGIGLSLGTNDWGTLVQSFRSLMITVGVSLVTSTVYFGLHLLVKREMNLQVVLTPNYAMFLLQYLED